MTRYRVPVADPLLLERDSWALVEGFRLISVDGPWLGHPEVTICTFEDDGAPADLEGKLVEPTLQTHYETNGRGWPTGNISRVTIMGRRVLAAPNEPIPQAGQDAALPVPAKAAGRCTCRDVLCPKCGLKIVLMP